MGVNRCRQASWVWVMAALTTPAPSQMEIGPIRDPHIAGVAQNSSKVQCSVRVDREVYLAGETARAWLTVTNPMHEMVEVFDPFHLSNAALVLRGKKLEEGEAGAQPVYRPLSPHEPRSWRSRSFNEPQEFRRLVTAWLKPGETREFEIDSAGEWFGKPFSPWYANGGIRDPGEYQIRYAYCPQAHVEFSVVPAVLIAHGILPLPRPLEVYDETERKIRQYPRALRAFALRLGEKSVVVVGRRDTPADTRLRTAPGMALSEYELVPFSPYDRVAEVNGPVANLAIRQLDETTFEVVWTEAGGRSVRRSYSPEHGQNNLIPE